MRLENRHCQRAVARRRSGPAAFPYGVALALVFALPLVTDEVPNAWSAPVTMQIRADAEQNLIYHLDCLARIIGCSRDNFAELWQALPKRDKDDVWLERWKNSRITPNTRSAKAKPGDSTSHPFDAPLHDVEQPVAQLSAKDYETLAYFQPRFDAWWKVEPGNHLKRMRLSLEHLAVIVELPDLLSGLARFHAVPNAAVRPVEVFLLSAPGVRKSPTHAEIRGDRAFVETRIGESGTVRMGVVAHEAAHYYYSLAPLRQRTRTREWFLTSERSWAIAAYHLFNEALAAAFGNGLVEARLLADSDFTRYVALPESFYADAYVDAAAKATQPLLDDYLRHGRALDRAFVDRYIEALGIALTPKMADIGFWLRSLSFTSTSSKLDPLKNIIGQYIVTGALFQETINGRCVEPCLLQRYPELSGIIVTLNDDVSALSEFLPDEVVRTVSRDAFLHQNSVFGFQRSPRSLLFVVSGRTVEDVSEGLQRLLIHGRIFEGVLPHS